MGWVIAMLTALFVLAAMIRLGRLPRATWELSAAVLALGLAGYAFQGNANLASAPRHASENAPPFDEALARTRKAFADGYGPSAQWLILSDGAGRSGDSAGAVNVLISGLKADSASTDLWVGMGNALVAHGNGMLTPPADYAFALAMRNDRDLLQAPFFYGLALARNGQLERARDLWTPLLAKLPPGNPVRAELARDLAMVNAAIARLANPETSGNSGSYVP